MKLLVMSCLVALAVVVGCNKAPFPVAPVRGTVKIDGQPMTQGKVMFAPVAEGGKLNSGRPAFGYIQSDGSFTVSTYSDGDGAVVGKHWVSVINGATPAGASAGTGKVPVTKSNFQRIVFPRQVVSVVAGQENQIDIAMTSQDIAKFGKVAKSDN